MSARTTRPTYRSCAVSRGLLTIEIRTSLVGLNRLPGAPSPGCVCPTTWKLVST